MSPPGLAPAPTRRNHVSGGKPTALRAALVSRYVALAMADPACQHLSANRVSRLVRGFVSTGQPEREFLSYIVGYSDPTGEAAVRHVIRERGW